jgi:hypothetical protein
LLATLASALPQTNNNNKPLVLNHAVMSRLKTLIMSAKSNGIPKGWGGQFFPPHDESDEISAIPDPEDLGSLFSDQGAAALARRDSYIDLEGPEVTIPYQSVLMADGNSVLQQLRSMSKEIKELRHDLDEERERRPRLADNMMDTFDDVWLELQRLSLEVESIKQERRRQQEEIESAKQAVQDNYEMLSNQDVQRAYERDAIKKALRILTEAFGTGNTPEDTGTDSCGNDCANETFETDEAVEVIETAYESKMMKLEEN